MDCTYSRIFIEQLVLISLVLLLCLYILLIRKYSFLSLSFLIKIILFVTIH